MSETPQDQPQPSPERSGARSDERIAFRERLDLPTVEESWSMLMRMADRVGDGRLTIDLSKVEYLDTAGVGLVLAVERRVSSRGGRVELLGLSDEQRALLSKMEKADLSMPENRFWHPASAPLDVGHKTWQIWHDARELVEYVGRLASAISQAAKRPGAVRWSDVIETAERAGANALPVVLLIAFVMGLVMAFQAAGPMSTFGTEVFVSDLISIAMLKELGALVTAIVLAGRTGSAFAAELGTMVVNEEVDALKTMGLDPVPFLVLPRVLAVTLVMPILTVFANLAGLVGGGFIVLGYGYPLVTYVNRVIGAAGGADLLSGLIKAVVFGLLVGFIGCVRGLQTGPGASSVGHATTSAVVSGLVLIAVADGVFSLVLRVLGL